jgi:hypothetical protein
VTNCRGNASEAAFLLGVVNGSATNSIASLSISDCMIKGPAVLGIAENFGMIALKNVGFVPSTSKTAWVNPQPNHICAFLRPSPLYGGVTWVGAKLYFENCKVYRNRTMEALAVILEYESTVENLVFNGFSVEGTIPELLSIGSGSIGELVLQSVDTSRITAPVSSEGFSAIGTVSGAGVLATGWEFPPAVVADGVPYLSSSSGLPTVNLAGKASPYPSGI